jgi:hypothetical protein
MPPLWLLIAAVAAVAGGGGKRKAKRVDGPPPDSEAAAATGALTIDTCASAYSWKGKPPAWIGQALDAIATAASQIPIPAVAAGVSTAVKVLSTILAKLKAGSKRSATVNPNSEDGEGVDVLVGSWSGRRPVSVAIYLQALRTDDENLWYLLHGFDQENVCAAFEGASQLSTTIAAWRTSGNLATTGELPPVKLDASGPGRFGDRIFENGLPDAMPPKYAAYLRGAAYPISSVWSGKVGTWVRPAIDTVRAGVVRDGDDYTLRVWLPARVGALRWTIFWTIGD